MSSALFSLSKLPGAFLSLLVSLCPWIMTFIRSQLSHLKGDNKARCTCGVVSQVNRLRENYFF